MIVIADYDPRWPALFESLRATLSAALGELVSRIEHLLFRDALRADAALVAAYAALKWRLANLHPQNRDAYTAAKTEFVETVLRAVG